MTRTGYSAAWTRGAAADQQANELTAELLSDELTLEKAVQVALLNNRNLQATFEELGISRGQLIQAGLPDNPVFGGEWKFFSEGTNLELVLTQNIISIITIPMRRQLRGYQFEATKNMVTARVVQTIAQTKRAWFLYQANKKQVELLQQQVQTVKASYMLRERMREAGNTRQLEVSQERIAYEEAKVQLNAAVEALAASREALNLTLGLWGPQTHWETPQAMPDVPGAMRQQMTARHAEPVLTEEQSPGHQQHGRQPADAQSPLEAARELAGPPSAEQLARPMPETLGPVEDADVLNVSGSDEATEARFAAVERQALERSLELASAWKLVEAEIGRLRFETVIAVFPFLELGGTGEREPDGEWGVGPAVDMPIPVFDFGQGRIPEEMSRLRQRLEHYASLAISIRATARAAEARYQAARSRATYTRDVILPLHAALVAETQLQYNAMQLGPFVLLRNKTAQIAAGRQYVAAQLEYWLARTDLEMLLDGSLPDGVLAGAVNGGGNVGGMAEMMPGEPGRQRRQGGGVGGH